MLECLEVRREIVSSESATREYMDGSRSGAIDVIGWEDL